MDSEGIINGLDNLYDIIREKLPSQRERIATAVAAGIRANTSLTPMSSEGVADIAVSDADALIAALEGVDGDLTHLREAVREWVSAVDAARLDLQSNLQHSDDYMRRSGNRLKQSVVALRRLVGMEEG